MNRVGETISLCMIAKNEADLIRKSLLSACGHVDDMVVVDTGSDDATPDIARACGAGVHHIEWNDDFSEARNYALDQARGSWVLVLDADEELVTSPGVLRDLAVRDDKVDGYFLKIVNYFGADAGRGRVNNLALRFFRNKPDYRFAGAVHEQLPGLTRDRPDRVALAGSGVCILHYGYLDCHVARQGKAARNLRILRKEVERHPEDPFARYNLGVECYRCVMHEEAATQLERALAEAPPGAQYTSRMFYYLANSVKSLGRHQDALCILDEGLGRYPDFTDLAFLKGTILYELGRLDEAGRMFGRCLEMGEAPACYISLEGVGSYRAQEALRAVERCKRDTDARVPHRSPRLSLCMIVRDEEKNLPRCLESVRGVVDEIVIVDTGSTDRTCEVARAAGAHLVHRPWTGSFSDARNASLEYATGDFVLILDADEALVTEDGPRLRDLLDSEADGFFLKEIDFLGERSGVDFAPHLAFRIFRNEKHYRYSGAIHEQILGCIRSHKPSARIEVCDVRILHYGYQPGSLKAKDKIRRNLEILQGEVARNPTDRFVRYNLGVEYFRLGDFARALQEFDSTYDASSVMVAYGPRLARYRVLCLKELRRYADALRAIDDGLCAYPDFTDLHFLRGLILQELGKPELAADAFHACLELGEPPVNYNPYDGVGTYRASCGLGHALEQAGKPLEAADAYLRAIQQNKEFADILPHVIELLKPSMTPDEMNAYLASRLGEAPRRAAGTAQ